MGTLPGGEVVTKRDTSLLFFVLLGSELLRRPYSDLNSNEVVKKDFRSIRSGIFHLRIPFC